MRRAGAALAVALAAALLPAPARAASAFTCEASALRGAVLTAPAFEPVTANQGQPVCRNAKAGGADALAGLPLPIALSAAAAQTAVSGSDAQPGSQKATAVGGLVDARVQTLPALPLKIPIPPIPEQLKTITIDPAQIPNPLHLPLPSQPITISIEEALTALLPDGALPSADVVRVQSAVAYATASCQAGRLATVGSSQVAGLTVLGQALPVDTALDRSFRLVDTPDVDPSDVDVSQLQLPPGIAPQLLPQVQALIQPALDALPDLVIPETLVRVKTTPALTIRDGDKLTQRAFGVYVSLLGQTLADLVLGEAAVSARDVACVPAPPPVTPPPAATPPVTLAPAAQQELACSTRRLVLVDVLRRGGRVKLFGVADRRLVGREVTVRFRASGRTVARPRVRPDGTFSATAPLPPRRLRESNRARYQAAVGSERSLDLKLARRMVWRSLRSAGGNVTLRGRVVAPLARPVAAITVKRRVSCRRFEVVKRFRPSRSGRFRVKVDAPPGQLAATYRLQTRVRRTARSRTTFHTFTLPRSVEIR